MADGIPARFAHIVYEHLFHEGLSLYISWSDIATFSPKVAANILHVIKNGGEISHRDLRENIFAVKNWISRLCDFWTGTEYSYSMIWQRGMEGPAMDNAKFAKLIFTATEAVEKRELALLNDIIRSSDRILTDYTEAVEKDHKSFTVDDKFKVKHAKKDREEASVRREALLKTLIEARQYAKDFLCYIYMDNGDLFVDLKEYFRQVKH